MKYKKNIILVIFLFSLIFINFIILNSYSNIINRFMPNLGGMYLPPISSKEKIILMICRYIQILYTIILSIVVYDLIYYLINKIIKKYNNIIILFLVLIIYFIVNYSYDMFIYKINLIHFFINFDLILCLLMLFSIISMIYHKLLYKNK